MEPHGTIPSEEQMRSALCGRIGRGLQRRLEASAVAVCGLGGLGSNIALSLARAGVGRLILIDFDRVDISNLNRQQYKASQVGRLKAEALAENLLEASPYARIESHAERLCAENFARLLDGAQIICEAFDSAEEKSLLASLVLENMPEKYLVAASGMAGLGSPNKIATRRVTSRFYLCGDGENGTEGGQSLFSARVALCAAHQALTVLRIIAGEFDV